MFSSETLVLLDFIGLTALLFTLTIEENTIESIKSDSNPNVVADQVLKSIQESLANP